MLNGTTAAAVGLSVAHRDDEWVTADLGSTRYRRWVERVQLVAEARQARRDAASARRSRAAAGRRIRIAAPASGILSRLP